jgi:hypothetical protein
MMNKKNILFLLAVGFFAPSMNAIQLTNKIITPGEIRSYANGNPDERDKNLDDTWILYLDDEDEPVHLSTFKDSLVTFKDALITDKLTRPQAFERFGYTQCGDTPSGKQVIILRSRFTTYAERSNEDICVKCKALFKAEPGN